MKFKLRFFCYISILSILILSACGSDNKDNSSAEGNDNKTELLFVAYSNYEEPLKAVIEDFEEQNPSISVELELSPITDLTETIEIKMGSKSEDIDLLFVDSPLTINYALKGYLEPLDDLLDSSIMDS